MAVAKTSGKGRRSPSAPRPGTKRRPNPLPILTNESAATFAKILSAGVPPKIGIRYFAPGRTPREQSALLQQWSNDPKLAAAVTAINSGEWHELDADKRLTVAMDKHDAELAYFLWTNNFVQAKDDQLLAKMKTARETLRQRLVDQSGETDGKAYRDMLTELIDGKLKPPQLDGIDDRAPIINLGENIPRERMQS